ncbi:MAG: glycosyltransferase family 4 protein [Armatimonadetes bacterium]|nr:glycosyltransferase family 4 protein [Armatimonadota bacterium]
MRILHFAAGAGQMYCGACARDMVMARGLIKLGHDFEITPLYTPLRIEGEEPVKLGAVYLGGINAWLQQHSAIFRWLPRGADRILDHPALLRWASRYAISTRPAKLGPMTVSVLAGREGRQRKEVEKLLDYLKSQPPVDLFSITNSLLSGLAPVLKANFAAPVVCGLQGEEDFVASLPARYQAQAQEWMRRNAESIDLFLAPGEAYADLMADFLAIPRERIRVVRPGVEYEQYLRPHPRPTDPFVVGYLSVITPRKGLDLLVRAWIKLVRQDGRKMRLRVAGRILDQPYFDELVGLVQVAGLQDEWEFLDEVDLAGKIAFLHQCSVFSVPSRFAETRGMAMMEAIAAGVPVVAPDSGIYPEMFGLLQGGALFAPGDVNALAAGLAQVQDDPQGADTAAARALANLQVYHDPMRMAQTLQQHFTELTGKSANA